MAGTSWRICSQCKQQSRDNRAWYCPHCDYLKPNVNIWDVVPLTARDVRVEAKPRKVNANVAAKAERRLEREQLAEDIAKIDRSKLPELKLRPKAGLRRENGA